MNKSFLIAAMLILPSGVLWAKDTTENQSNGQLKQVIKWATQGAVLNTDELKNAAQRARQSAGIPDVQVRYAYGVDDTFRASQDGSLAIPSSSIDSTQVREDEHRVQLGLRWRLSGLLFHPAETRLLAQQHRRVLLKYERAQRAVRSFLAWEQTVRELEAFHSRVITDESSPDGLPASTNKSTSQRSSSRRREQKRIVKLRQKIRSHRADLDLLTNGRFSSTFGEEDWP